MNERKANRLHLLKRLSGVEIEMLYECGGEEWNGAGDGSNVRKGTYVTLWSET